MIKRTFNNTKTTLTIEGDTVVIKQNGTTITDFDWCLVFDVMRDNTSTENLNPGQYRRLMQLKGYSLKEALQQVK